ncbi:MAG: DUF2442 domain-containing protein [Deltaproteobacteria bacterium]|nr:DUF2442 domain-containing protein [Deltaproteobacteria bacterium]
MLAVIREAKPLTDFSVEITWEEGDISVISLHEIVAKGGVFAPLSDPKIFGQLKIGEGARWLEWPGEVDICADTLWYQAHPNAKIDELELIKEISRTSSDRQQ